MTVFMNKCGEKKKFVKFYMFTQIVKHFTDTSDFQTLVWDMQNSSEGLPEKSQTVFSYLSKFVLMYVVFLYFGFRIYVCVCVCVFIQGVPGGMCQTSGGCSLC